MKLQRFILAFLLFCLPFTSYGTPTAKPGDPAMDEIPGYEAADAFQDSIDQSSLDQTVADFMAMPELAGEKIAIRIGSHFAVVDRTLEAKVKQPNDTATIMDKIISLSSRSTAASASMHISWQHEYIDENGKVVRDNLQFDIGVATGAAAAAQAEMEKSMSAQRR